MESERSEDAGPTVDLTSALQGNLEFTLSFLGPVVTEEENSVNDNAASESFNESSNEGRGIVLSTEVLPGWQQETDENDKIYNADSKPSAETPPVDIPCNFSNLGCKTTFEKHAERTKHANKCMYSIFQYCKDSKCIASGTAKFEHFKELVNHSIEEHDCVQTKNLEGDMILPFSLSKEFLEPKSNEVNVKLLTCYETERDVTAFRIVFVLLVKDQKLTIIPVLLCGSSMDSSDNYVRLTIEMLDSLGNAIPVSGSLAHPSHTLENGGKVLSSAIGDQKLVLESIKKKIFATYATKAVVGQGHQSEMINLKLKVNAEPFRCRLLTVDASPLQPYMLTWKETGLEDSTRDVLCDNNVDENKPQWYIPEMHGTLIPQLIDNADMLIECNDLKQVLSCCLSAVLSLKNGKPKVGRMGRFFKAILLFPSLNLLRAQEKALLSKTEGLGLKAASLINCDVDEDMHDWFDECDLIMSTPNDLLIGNNSTLLLDKIKFLVLPNADHLLRGDNLARSVKQCLAILPEKKRQKLVKVAICQNLNQNLLSTLNENVLQKDFKGISVGQNLYEISDILQVSRQFSPTFDITVNSVIEIIGAYNESSSTCAGSWLVIADEHGQEYSERFDAIISKLSGLPSQTRWRIFRCDETDTRDGVPIVLERFEQDSDGVVLLTSYFALNFEQVKQCGSIIVIKDAQSVFGTLEMLSLLSICSTDNGKNKTVYSLFG